MTDTTVTVPGYVTMIEPGTRQIADVAHVTAHLMTDAEAAGLPAPGYIEILAGGRDITLAGFGRDQAACKALATWAEHHGATLTGKPGTGSDGSPYVLCEAAFIYQGTHVGLRAYIEAGQDTEGNADA